MGKYTNDATEMLKLIGGKENISAVAHCMTRMRFVLNDPAKADVKALEKMAVVKGTFTQAGQFWAGVDKFLWLIGEAVFQIGIPVGICWSVAKKMGTTQMLGIILGITLVSPQLLNAYSVASTAAADIPKWDFGFIQVNFII